MRTFSTNKLWRDKIPEKHRKNGGIINTAILDDIEYDKQLRRKMEEELQEIIEAIDRKSVIEEIADLYEVIDAFCQFHAIAKSDIIAQQESKRQERGGFFGRTFVTTIEYAESSDEAAYCLERPDKYPEIMK